MRKHDRSIAEAERAIALDPNFAPAYVALAVVLTFAGQPAEALPFIERAMQLDPHYPDAYLQFRAQAEFQLGHYNEAISWAKKRIARNPETDASRVLVAASYGHLGGAAEARAAWTDVHRVNPGYSLDHPRDVLPYKYPADFERIVEGLHKAGLPE